MDNDPELKPGASHLAQQSISQLDQGKQPNTGSNFSSLSEHGDAKISP